MCGRGGIGRRAALRSLWVNSPWKFESSRPHHLFPDMINERPRLWVAGCRCGCRCRSRCRRGCWCGCWCGCWLLVPFSTPAPLPLPVPFSTPTPLPVLAPLPLPVLAPLPLPVLAPLPLPVRLPVPVRLYAVGAVCAPRVVCAPELRRLCAACSGGVSQSLRAAISSNSFSTCFAARTTGARSYCHSFKSVEYRARVYAVSVRTSLISCRFRENW